MYCKVKINYFTPWLEVFLCVFCVLLHLPEKLVVFLKIKNKNVNSFYAAPSSCSYSFIFSVYIYF